MPHQDSDNEPHGGAPCQEDQRRPVQNGHRLLHPARLVHQLNFQHHYSMKRTFLVILRHTQVHSNNCGAKSPFICLVKEQIPLLNCGSTKITYFTDDGGEEIRHQFDSFFTIISYSISSYNLMSLYQINYYKSYRHRLLYTYIDTVKFIGVTISFRKIT